MTKNSITSTNKNEIKSKIEYMISNKILLCFQNMVIYEAGTFNGNVVYYGKSLNGNRLYTLPENNLITMLYKKNIIRSLNRHKEYLRKELIQKGYKVDTLNLVVTPDEVAPFTSLHVTTPDNTEYFYNFFDLQYSEDKLRTETYLKGNHINMCEADEEDIQKVCEGILND